MMLARMSTSVFLHAAFHTRIRFALTPMILVDILTVLVLVPALRGRLNGP